VPRSASGQAATEYVAVLAVLAVVVALAGAVAAPDVAGAVVRQVRLALCTVGGDVCRSADATREGLEPCPVREAVREDHEGVDILFLRVGDDRLYAFERRSDGSVAITRTHGGSAGVTAGVGVQLGLDGVELELEAGGDLGFRSGTTWVLPDERTGLAFAEALAAGRDLPRAAREVHRYREGTAGADGDVSILGVSGAGIALEGAAGRRTGPDGTTWYLDGETPGVSLLGESAGGRLVVLEYTFDRAGQPRLFTVKGVRPGGGHGRVVETTGTLDMRDAANRAAVGRLLSVRPPWDLGPLRDMRDHLARHALVEERVYAVERRSEGYEVEAAWGPKVGLRKETVHVLRRLVAARVRPPGEPIRDRVDCTGLA